MEHIQLKIDAETFPILSKRSEKEIIKTIVKLLEYHKMEPTEENIYGLLVQLESDLEGLGL
ncbi:MAG: hypothetical protein WHV26_15430 [Spirochaetota bacterium]